MKKIIITQDDKGKCSIAMEGAVSWEDFIRIVVPAIEVVANGTSEEVLKGFHKTCKENKLKNPPSDEKFLAAVKGDLADHINFAVSNILDHLSPKDPDLQLSEKAIATCENIVIHYAADHGMTIKEALDCVERILSEYVFGPDYDEKAVSDQ